MSKAQIVAERAAFLAGIEIMYKRLHRQIPQSHRQIPQSQFYRMPSWEQASVQWEAEAARLYPIPKTPRIVPIRGLLYRFVNGQFECKDLGVWIPATTFTAEVVDAFVDLRKNPEVDVE